MKLEQDINKLTSDLHLHLSTSLSLHLSSA